MNALEMQLDYVLGEQLPEAGAAIEVAPGVRWLRMRLPFALDHVNLWLLRDCIAGRDGWTVVDCGIADDATRAAWEQVFEGQLDGLPVLRLIVTHMHPDHIGLADWLCERWGCRMWISAADFHAAQRGASSHDSGSGERLAAFMAGHGIVDPAALDALAARKSHYAQMVPRVPGTFRRMIDGDVLTIGGDAWRCIVGHGHAPEHMALHCEARQWLIAGDMLLPRISTNISVSAEEPEADPLPRYLASIERLRPLAAETRVLPSHGKPFRGLQQRIDQLQAHHAERLAEVAAACAEAPRSAADLLPVLFRRRLDLQQLGFAMGESIAHLHALWLSGRLERRLDGDGVLRFSAI